MLKKSRHATRKIAKWFQNVTKLGSGTNKTKGKTSKTKTSRTSARRKKYGSKKHSLVRIGRK